MGFTWNFDSVVTNSNLRGVKGTEGQPASFVLEGKIKPDGSAKLSGNGISGQKNMRALLSPAREIHIPEKSKPSSKTQREAA